MIDPQLTSQEMLGVVPLLIRKCLGVVLVLNE